MVPAQLRRKLFLVAPFPLAPLSSPLLGPRPPAHSCPRRFLELESQTLNPYPPQVMPRAKARALPASLGFRSGPAKLKDPDRPPQPKNPIFDPEGCKQYIVYTVGLRTPHTSIPFLLSCHVPRAPKGTLHANLLLSRVSNMGALSDASKLCGACPSSSSTHLYLFLCRVLAAGGCLGVQLRSADFIRVRYAVPRSNQSQEALLLLPLLHHSRLAHRHCIRIPQPDRPASQAAHRSVESAVCADDCR